MSKTADSIYTSFTPHTIPHRWRIRQVIRLLQREQAGGTFADIGCADGLVTARIAEAIAFTSVNGFDYNPDVIRSATEKFPTLRFSVFNMIESPVPGQFDTVTCMETLEHVSNIRQCISRLLDATRKLLLITVPIETGRIGLVKASAKAILRRPIITDENTGTVSGYLRALASGEDVSRFRKEAPGWAHHTGFDNRVIDSALADCRAKYNRLKIGWNYGYVVRKTADGNV